MVTEKWAGCGLARTLTDGIAVGGIIPGADGVNTYLQIRWWIAVKLTVPNMPDFTFEYVIEVEWG